jgi:flavin-dependent dehydrogenase
MLDRVMGSRVGGGTSIRWEEIAGAMSSLEEAGPLGAEADRPPRVCDVLVIGGGPAGSTISSLLAEKGWKVTVLEKDHHPRFHIGESLLPMNLPILERLGVLEQVREIGILKPGVEMWSDRRSGRSQAYYFDRLIGHVHPHAFQVRRSEFDDLLLQNAGAWGVDIHQGARVTEVAFRAKSPTLVRARDDTGTNRVWAARYVVDASGRNAFLSTRLGLKVKNDKHNSTAVFGHFKGVARGQGRDEGNIALYWFEHGWFWMIPLPDGVMSVGAVCWPDYLKTRGRSLDDFLWDTIRLSPEAHGRMKNAELIGPARATGNYAYHSKRMWGEGYLLIGDAYAFVDPVFSSGVYLAMTSAVQGAEVVDACLREGRSAVRLLERFEGRVRGGLKTLSWFIYRFTTPAIHDLFMAPRDIFRIEQAVLATLAGDIFDRKRTIVPIILFKTLYYVAATLSWGRSWASYRRRKDNVRLPFTDGKTTGQESS